MPLYFVRETGDGNVDLSSAGPELLTNWVHTWFYLDSEGQDFVAPYWPSSNDCRGACCNHIVHVPTPLPAGIRLFPRLCSGTGGNPFPPNFPEPADLILAQDERTLTSCSYEYDDQHGTRWVLDVSIGSNDTVRPADFLEWEQAAFPGIILLRGSRKGEAIRLIQWNGQMQGTVPIGSLSEIRFAILGSGVSGKLFNSPRRLVFFLDICSVPGLPVLEPINTGLRWTQFPQPYFSRVNVFGRLTDTVQTDNIVLAPIVSPETLPIEAVDRNRFERQICFPLELLTPGTIFNIELNCQKFWYVRYDTSGGGGGGAFVMLPNLAFEFGGARIRIRPQAINSNGAGFFYIVTGVIQPAIIVFSLTGGSGFLNWTMQLEVLTVNPSFVVGKLRITSLGEIPLLWEEFFQLDVFGESASGVLSVEYQLEWQQPWFIGFHGNLPVQWVWDGNQWNFDETPESQDWLSHQLRLTAV